jgi:KEOPS complex subunit Cgi121
MESNCDIREAVIEIPALPAFLETIREISESTGTHIICFDADELAGKAHAAKAVRHALRAWQEGRAIANTLEMEALLYAAGTRQCRVATDLGLHAGTNRCYVCLCPPSEAAAAALGKVLTWTEEDWEEIGSEKERRLMERYDITPEEIEAACGRIRPLIMERVALLEVNR